jgi:hypothetical protein
MKLKLRTPQRFLIDPNQRSRMHPEWVPADLQPGQNVAVGDRVVAVQPEQGEPNYIGDAWVKRVDREFGLVFLQPEWETFHDESYAESAVGDSVGWSFVSAKFSPVSSVTSGSVIGGRFAHL